MVQGLNTVLSEVTRNQVFAMKTTQRSLDATQLVLASGKDVNKAIDSPQNFFAAQSLRDSAGDKSKLLDQYSVSIRTIQEANSGIESIQKLIDQAENLLEELGKLYRDSEDFATSIVPNDISEITTYIPGQDMPATGTPALINNGEGLSLDGNFWKRFAVNYTITEDTILELDYQSFLTPEIATIGFDNDQNFLNDSNRFHLNGTQTTGIAFAAPIGTFSYSSAPGELERIRIPVGEFFTGQFDFITFINDDDNPNSPATSPGNFGDSTFQSIRLFEGIKTIPPAFREEAEQLASDYLKTVDQITQIAQDSSFRGINLLADDDLEIVFNSQTVSTLEVKGTDATLKGLGLEGLDVLRFAEFEPALQRIRDAREGLREYSASLATNFSIIQSRQDFTESTINTFQSGADDLTLADLNEASANLLALQTRQEIQFSTLGLGETSFIDLLF